jgi:SpoVK/Ycf46/Vps4 family AAA+-type ATPase
VNLAELAGAASEGQSGADIELACRNASLAAIREYLAIHKDNTETGDHLAIRMEHFRAAVSGTGMDR